LANKDLFNNLAVYGQLNVTITSTSARVGDIVDRKGYESVLAIMSAGQSTAGSTSATVFTLIHGDSSGLGDGAVVTDDYLINNTTAASWTWTSTGSDGDVERVGYLGDKRYLQMSVACATTKESVPVGFFIFGNPRSAPVST